MHVFIHVDADPDNFSMCKINADRQAGVLAGSLKWNGLLATLDYFEELSEKLNKLGLAFRTTFFLRADEQIKNLCGAYSEIFSEYYHKIGQFFTVGWHPHLYRWSEGCHCWYQEYQDGEWMSRVLTDCYDDLKSHGFPVGFSKMGWCFHNNLTMKTLSSLGIKADFSALPGAKSPGYLENGLSFQNRFDWSRTNAQPYHPNENDYQSIGNLKILEIPLTTYRVGGLTVFFYTIKLALISYLRFDFSYFPSFRVTVPLFLANLKKKEDLEKACELQGKNEKHYMTMYLHPDVFLDANKRVVFENFILRLVSKAEENGTKISFRDAPRLYEFISKM